MTTWSDYKPPFTMVAAGDGVERPVRGLSLDDLGVLIVNHLDTMMEITTLYIQSQKDIFATGNMTDLLMLVSRQFPGFISEVISMVTDEPSLKNVKLGVGLQLSILSASLKLTVEDAGGLGNLSATLQGLVRTAADGRQGEASQRLQAILSRSSTSGVAKTRTS